jgi:tRNA dimethylallyltransferase
MNNYLIAIVGATAIGKTALSIKLAQYFNAEIISCDSRQFYKEMTIGTAVPTTNELASATHHFIQNRSIFDDYSVGNFEKDALNKLENLFLKNNIAVMVGGSGLYANAVIDGLDYFPKVDSEIREILNKRMKTEGLLSLQQELKTLDIESYNTIELDNPHRLIRALEICIGTGKTYHSFKNQSKHQRNFKTIKIGLEAERGIMYERINQRVDLMLQEGLLEEATALYQFKNLNALQTVGYRELFDYLEGKCTLEFAIDEIKKNTRRFAKRQVTWNKKDTEINWFNFQTPVTEIFTFTKNLITQ